MRHELGEDGPRVVVVDDNRDSRRLLAQILAGRGYQVFEAVDGRHALDVIATASPDLVLLDLRMPRADGFAVLEALAAREAGFLPVVVVSGVTEREDRVRALKLGAHEFLAKPVDSEELAVRVGTLLALKRAKEACELQRRLLAGHNLHLEYEVVRRTAKLRAANVRLKAANRHKDEFIAVVSHELRTPLAAISGAAANLADGVAGHLKPLQRALLDLVVAGAERLGGMIEDLIEFAELRTGRASLEFNPTPFGSLVDEAVLHVGPRAEAAGVRLKGRVEVTDPVCLDARRVFGVLCKLLDNAIRFTPRGGVVTVDARVEGDLVRCAVSDTGVGIAREELPGLFDVFRQLDMSTTREAGGLGLGLSLARAYVEGHGGTIEVASESGAGSTFTLTLPLNNAREAAYPLPVPPPGVVV
ncbi:MAG: hybrid sensor histidine kinase/response regulator [Candidatus Sericytochromatia bacterium]|nr:hybrid sensor histidine kinase/response regulator [Candidatus Tanganyikabacteria bacterium]